MALKIKLSDGTKRDITTAERDQIRLALNLISSMPSVLPAMSTIVGFGDSITVGVAASPESSGGWFGRLATALNATGLNQAISGTVLQNSPDAGGSARANNGRNRFVAALTGSNARQGVFVAYGFNDARYTAAPSTFNVANYENDLGEVIAGLRMLGYAANRIFVLSPYWISDTGLNTGSTGFAGQTRVEFEKFVAAAERVAVANGTWYCDLYAGMRDNGGAALISGDAIHPTTEGHAAIFNLVSTTSFQPNTRATSALSANGGVEQCSYTITAAAGAIGYEVERAIDGTYAFGSPVDTTSLTGTISGLAANSYRLRARPVYDGGVYGPWAYASATVVVTAASTGGGGEPVSLVLDDGFTAADGTALTAHSAEVGGAPVIQNGFTPTGGGNAIANNRVYMRGNAAVYQYPSAMPASADHEVTGYFACLTEMSTELVGIAARMAASANTLIFARYQRSSGNWQLYQIVNGTPTQIGSNLPDAFPELEMRRARLRLVGANLAFTIYGNDLTTEIGTITGATTVTANGAPGLYGGMSGGTSQSPTTGTHIDRLTMGPLT